MDGPACSVGVSQQWLASTLLSLSEEVIEISGEGKIFLTELQTVHLVIRADKDVASVKNKKLFLIMAKCADFSIMECQ